MTDLCLKLHVAVLSKAEACLSLEASESSRSQSGSLES